MAFTYTTGSQVGRFILETEIGHGSTGIVYRARDVVFQRPVALKILAQHLTLDESARARFEREATAVARLKHPHIAQIHEFAVLPDCLYLATEWVEGRTLAALLKDHKPLPLNRALKLFDQLASAIDYAHQQGVIHYDIKPANVMVDAKDRAYIVDFELAWLSDAPASTNAGMLFGTPRYMAPEQIRGEAVDGRADIYSLAAMLFEMLTGQPPFTGESTPALLYHHLYTAPPPVTEVNPSLPTSVETALLRALAKRPINRFDTAAKFGRALRSPIHLRYPVGPVKRGTAPLNAPPPPPARRQWLPAGLPIWLWAVVAGSFVVWMLTFLAFRAHRLTLLPVPTVMATLTPQPDRVIVAHIGGTFSPQDLSPTPDMDDIPTPGPGTPARSARQGNALALTALGPELDISVPLTLGAMSLTMTASATTPTTTAESTASPVAATPSPPAPTTGTQQSATPTTAGTNASSTQTPTTTTTSAVASQTGTTVVTDAAASRTPTRTATFISAVPALPSPTTRPSPTRTPTPSRTSTLVPTATATPPPTATKTPIPSATATATMAAPAAGGWWPMISGDAANSGFVAAGFPLLAPTPRWQVPASGGREFGMVVGNGLVIFSTIGTDVRALNWATGAAVWNRNLGAQLVGELILESIGGGQAIVVAPTSQGLLALDLQSGTIAWRSTSEGLLSAPLGGVTAGSNGALYAVTRGGWLYALNPADGRLQWSRQLTPLDEYTLPPTLAGATLLMTSRSRVVRAFDLNSLRVLWAQTLPENLVTPPCASETLGLVYVGSETGTLYTLWLNSGAIAWTAHTSSQVSGLAHDNGQIYATASDGTVSAWDGAAGALVWAVPVGDPIYSPPLTDGTQVMVTTLGGQVRYLSTATGQELGSWRISLNDPFYQGAAPAGGWLFVRGSSLYGVSP